MEGNRQEVESFKQSWKLGKKQKFCDFRLNIPN